VTGAWKTTETATSVEVRCSAPEERTEIVAQLQRSLALLRGCDAPGTRAQIASLIGGLSARLRQIETEHPGDSQISRFPRLLPSPSACELGALECRAFAIQCESLASATSTPAQRQMLLALARLWRGLAEAQ
jgi:hypothetical protein